MFKSSWKTTHRTAHLTTCHCGRTLSVREPLIRGMAEWSNALHLKCSVPQGTGGSNPSSSAGTVCAILQEFHRYIVYMEMKRNRADRRKYHIIYKTTCLITNKFYIGMHSTDNLEDGYIGSGKRLWRSVNKHGKENHVTEILEMLPDRSSLKEREKQIVNEELLGDKMCMNLMMGGEGGFISEENQFKRASAGGKAAIESLKNLRNNKEWVKNNSESISNGITTAIKEGRFTPPDWNGRKHSNETIQKMKESKKDHGIGSTNSQFGKCWITNDIESKKIAKGDQIPEGWRLGRKIKKK